MNSPQHRQAESAAGDDADAHPAPQPTAPAEEDQGRPERRFHVWRLLAVIVVVNVALAVIAAVVDIMVLG